MMEKKEHERTFVGAALILMLLGVVTRIYLGNPAMKEILLCVGVVATAVLAAVLLRRIPLKRFAKYVGRFWGVPGYTVLLGLGVLLMLGLRTPEGSIAPTIAAVLPLLAQLPLFRYTRRCGTRGFVLALAGWLGAVIVVWVMGFVAAFVITALVGFVVILICRKHFGEGDERWIGHLILVGVVVAGLCLLFATEMSRPWIWAWLETAFAPGVNSFGEAFQNYVNQTLWNSAKLLGGSELEEILVWEEPARYMAVSELLPSADDPTVLTTIAYYLGLIPSLLVFFFLAFVPVCGVYLGFAQQGFRRYITLMITLFFGVVFLLYGYQSAGYSFLMIDFCPLFSGGFENFLYVLLVLMAASHDSPLTEGAERRGVRHMEDGEDPEELVHCRLLQCGSKHEEIAALKKQFVWEQCSSEEVEDAFAAADVFTVFVVEGTYYAVHRTLRKASFACQHTAIQALLIEYTDEVSYRGEAKELQELICANFVDHSAVQISTAIRHSGDACRDPKGYWRIVVAMGVGTQLSKEGSAQVDTVNMVS